MTILGAILSILAGLAIMAFGLLLFYAWLPVFYGLFGFDIGLLLGRSLTGDVGVLAIVLGIIGAIILAVAAYTLEPYRRILLGVSGGVLLGLALAAMFDLDGPGGGFLGALLAVIGGLIGASVVPRYFDSFIIVASAFGGAVLLMAGAHLLLPGVALFDRASGDILPRLLTIVLTLIGIGWQASNIAKWVRRAPTAGE
jgi:hypothetical protein